MDTNGATVGRVAGVGLGAYVALAGAATLVGMPWQYAGGGAALAALRILGGVIAVVGGAALAWFAATGARSGSGDGDGRAGGVGGRQ